MAIQKRDGETGAQFRARQALGMEERELPAGTVLHMNGVPVRLVGAATVEAHEGNWPVIDGDVVATDADALTQSE